MRLKFISSPRLLWPQRLLLISLGILAAGLLLLGGELALRLMGFSAELQPIVVVGSDGKSQPDDKLGWVEDPELRYRFQPGGVWRYRPINSLGFLGREVEPTKAAGTVRVITMGDSCTATGIPPYADILHERLTAAPPTPEPWEAFNMAVHGYSTEQGLRLFRKQTRHLDPDYVTLYFGWNDHWRTSTTDRMLMPRQVSPLRARIQRILARSLVYQFAVSRSYVRQTRDADNYFLRVPPEEYRRNLMSLISEIRAVGAVPILITAPRGSKLTPLLVANRQVARLEDAYRLHDEYADITRAVAKKSGAPLLDLARQFQAEGPDALFNDDGIHQTQEGRMRIAEEIYKLLSEIQESVSQQARS